MSVEQNVAFGLKQDRLAKSEIRTRDHADLVKMGSFAKRNPISCPAASVSALRRSLVKRPKLVAGRALGALDKKLREHTYSELISLQDKLGVTHRRHPRPGGGHDAGEPHRRDNHGEIVAGTPSEIYEFPGSKLVADFAVR